VRKLVVAEYVSLDGVIQAPGHAGEDDAGGFLLGRLTYEIFAASWPKVTDEHDQIVRALNTLPKYVASRSLPQAELAGHHGPRRRRAGCGRRPEAAAGQAPGGRRQRPAGPDAAGGRPGRRVPAVAAPGRAGRRQAAVPRRRPPASFRLADSTTTSGGLVLLTYDRP
jgi:hypothetical protein